LTAKCSCESFAFSQRSYCEFRLCKGRIALALSTSFCAFIVGPALAESAANREASKPTETITVTATRAPIHVINAPATVSVISAAQLDDTLVGDIKDAIRFEPGVSVRSQPSRFSAALSSTGRDGNAGFNIRGLEGNRVLIQTDGIRLPDAFAFGAQSVGRGDYADLDLVKSIEILRGPASPLYGSDGLAGAVSFTTKDPEDFLNGDANFGGRARFGFSEADDSKAVGLAVAGQVGAFSGLIAITRRDSEAQGNAGTNDAPDITRTAPNPQSNDSEAILAKLVWSPNDAHRLRFTFENQDRDSRTNVLSARALPPLGATSTLDLQAGDELARERINLDWRYDGVGLIKTATAAIYRQTSKTRQFTAEDRNIYPDRTRDNSFNNEIIGGSFQATSNATTGTNKHAFLLGGDISSTLQSGTRDGTIPPFGETFPTRAFPDTNYNVAGLFIQDSIDIGDGRLMLYPAVRIDHYKLDPKADPLFIGTPAAQEDTHVSPKFGGILWANPQFGLFANYAVGFRSPTPSQVNNGFTNVIQNYRSLASPDLKPETSTSYEGGIRLRDIELGPMSLIASAAVFTGRYKDFIEQRQVGGTFTPTDPGLFQYVNIGSVEISGAEARIDARFGSRLSGNFAASYTTGESQTGTGLKAPLSSIDPVKLVAGLRYRAPDNRFGGQLIVTHSQGKDQTDVNEVCSPNCFVGEGFTLLDATAFVTLWETATLRIGIFNLTDEKYAWWSDIRGLFAGSTPLDAYTQPRRNISASLTLTF
jgi:hemoglobin/transferrin/lactoferrin receptor protein